MLRTAFMRFVPMSFAFLALIALACSSAAPVVERTPSASYERGCAVDDDCFLILQSERCDCECPSASIAKSAKAKYEADRAAMGECKDTCTATCAPRARAACVEGRCGVHYLADEDAGAE